MNGSLFLNYNIQKAKNHNSKGADHAAFLGVAVLVMWQRIMTKYSLEMNPSVCRIFGSAELFACTSEYAEAVSNRFVLLRTL